jgi:hypothetical protein
VSSSGFGNSPSGQVNFFSGNTLIGNGPLGSNGITQNGAGSTAFFTTSALPAGQDSITATYVGDSNYVSSTSAATTVTLDADFAFSAQNATVTVTHTGDSGTNSLTITGQAGYNSTINFSNASCSGLPQFSKCTFSPPSVTGNGSTVVTISTAAPTAASRGFGFAASGFIFAGILLLNVPIRRSRSLALSFLLFVVIAMTGTGCGGGSPSGGGGGGSPGTPTGNYPIVITAATSDGAVSHTASFTFAVQ